MKTTITRAEYLQLLGLTTLADKAFRDLNSIDAAAIELLDIVEGERAQGDGSGCADDYVRDAMGSSSGNGSERLRELFIRIGVTVEGVASNKEPE